MRRNVHQWFVTGFALSIVPSLVLYFGADARIALRALAFWQIAYLLACVSLLAARWLYHATFSRQAVRYSRELPCRVVKQPGLETRRTYARG